MCGRFFLDMTFEALLERYGLPGMPGFSYAHGEITPSMMVFSLTPEGPLPLEWGLDYSFMKRPLINARLETLLEKPLFQKHFVERRCLIPVNHFYEWDREKDKFRVATNEAVFSLAGLYREDGKVALLTRQAGDDLASIHHREPVYVPRELERRFLESRQPQKIRDFFLKEHPQWLIEKEMSS